MVYIFLGNGFEEAEATVPYDILVRGGVETAFVGVDGKNVTGAHGIGYNADYTLDDIDLEKAEMIVVPGGLGGVETIERSRAALDIIKTAFDRGIEVAAICAGPRVLSGLGILKGKKATCYPGMDSQMDALDINSAHTVVRDERVTTGRGPGASFDFGFALLEVLRGKEAAAKVAGEMYYKK